MITVSARPYTLHFQRPARTSRGDLITRQIWFLRAWHSEQPAIVGLGECGPVPNLSIDATDDFGEAVEKLCTAINQGHNFSLSKRPALAFGLEMALLDLQTGGRQRLFATPFTGGEASLPTHGLIWMDSIDGVLAQIEHKVAQGYPVIKLKVGALPFAEECALLAEVRRQYPTIILRLDANGAFASSEALAKLDQLARYDIHFLEQPIRQGDWPTSAEIFRHSPIPLALDEELIGVSDPAQRRALLEAICPQHLILKPTLLGGFAASQQWVDLCAELGVEWWVNSLLESNIGLNAICQWSSQFTDGRIHGLGTGQLFTNNLPSPLQLQGNALYFNEKSTPLLAESANFFA